MRSDAALHVAGAIVHEPRRAVPVSWAWLTPDDFEDQRLRAIFEASVEAWGMVEAEHKDLPARNVPSWQRYLDLTIADGGEALDYVMHNSLPLPGELLERACRAQVAEKRLETLRLTARAAGLTLASGEGVTGAVATPGDYMALACSLQDLSGRILEMLRVQPKERESTRTLGW